MLIYFLFIIFVFFIGILGLVLIQRNLILIFICIELILIVLNFGFIICTIQLDDIIGQIVFIDVLALAGSEISIGLCILIIFYRIRGIIHPFYLNALKG
jgi:NADH-quinone oxidoreductase subunit K